jgi:hypothetical protein
MVLSVRGALIPLQKAKGVPQAEPLKGNHRQAAFLISASNLAIDLRALGQHEAAHPAR